MNGMDLKNFGTFVFQAANLGAKFKGRVLQISWFKPKTPSVTTEPEDDESKDEENRVQQQFLMKEHLSIKRSRNSLYDLKSLEGSLSSIHRFYLYI